MIRTIPLDFFFKYQEIKANHSRVNTKQMSEPIKPIAAESLMCAARPKSIYYYQEMEMLCQSQKRCNPTP